MPRSNLAIRDLIEDVSAIERRIAMMRAAGGTEDSIAFMIERDHNYVREVIRRPHVANLILLLTASIGESLAPAIDDVKEAIEFSASEAFALELRNMRELDTIGSLVEDDSTRIRAKIAAVDVAKDILDRAGKRAPTRIVQAKFSANIPADALERVANVVKEIHGGTVVEVHEEDS